MSTDANNEIEKAPPHPTRRYSWLKPTQSDKLDSASFTETEKPNSHELCIPSSDEDNPKPVSLFGLFRSVLVPIGLYHIIPYMFPLQVLYSYRTHLQWPWSYRRGWWWCITGACLNFLLFLTNACFPQPLMSLLFGNLTQQFVSFASEIQNLNPNDPQSTALLDQAAQRFRHVAAQDASYLTYIGA